MDRSQEQILSRMQQVAEYDVLRGVFNPSSAQATTLVELRELLWPWMAVGRRVWVRLDAPGPGSLGDSPSAKANYKRQFTRRVIGTIQSLDPLMIHLEVTEDNLDDWCFLMPDGNFDDEGKEKPIEPGDNWLADWIDESAIEGAAP